MEIRSFESLPSTQQYLLAEIERGGVTVPTAVIAAEQTAGIGSRENSWAGGRGNFFASVAVDEAMLPEDLPPASASIYFAFLMKEALSHLGEDVWLKWPNDLYLQEAKIGGVITRKRDPFLVVGIGINLKKDQNGYSSLDTDISPLILLNIFLEALQKKPKWKQVFSQFKIEFDLNKSYFTHYQGERIAMQDAILCSDGSLTIEGEKVYSLR